MENKLDWKTMDKYEVKANKTLHCKIGDFDGFIISKKKEFELSEDYPDFEQMRDIVNDLNKNEELVSISRIETKFLNLFDGSMQKLMKTLRNIFIEIKQQTFGEVILSLANFETIVQFYDGQIGKFGDRVSWTPFSLKISQDIVVIREYAKNPENKDIKIYTQLNHNHLKK